MHWIALQPPPDAAATPPELAERLTAWGWRALEFTPKVACVYLEGQAGAPNPASQVLLLEVSASERLFGGRRSLLAKIFGENGIFSKSLYQESATSLVAISRLQMQVQGLPVVPVDALPLHTLATATPHLGTLARVGVRTWGQLKALPRGGVARRFGADLLDALDRAYGLKPEIYPWLTLPDVFSAQLELVHQVENAPALLFAAQRLFRQLQLWLQLRHHGVTLLQFGWTMDARRNTATEGHLQLRTAEATQDTAHLQRLLAENLARVTLPAPALYLHLQTLQTEALASTSASLLLEDVQKGDSLHQMVERLQARLGAGAVLHLTQYADHRPEQMQCWKPLKMHKINTNIATDKSANYWHKNSENRREIILNVVKTPLYPTWLLAAPLPLAVLNHTPHYQGPLALLAGPQRIEVGWWVKVGEAGPMGVRSPLLEAQAKSKGLGDWALTPMGPALRDYYIAQSPQAGLVWVYRERLGAAAQGGKATPDKAVPWYLHGLFM